MIASLFRKSTPLNYTLVIIGLVFFFFLYQISQATAAQGFEEYVLKFSMLAFIFASVFVSNFIVKKNGLCKDSAYTVLFYLCFLLFFPGIFDDFRMVLANFFVLLAMRRIISLHSVKSTKEKLFDASLWIFLATFFNFWCIIFLLLVFISILFHASRDYRNWFLPFIAFFTAATVFVMFALMVNKTWITDVLMQSNFNLRINYFENNYENAALSVYATIALFFSVSLAFSISNRPLILHSSYKKILWWFFLSVAVFVMSPGKSNDLLVFTFAPLAMMATSHIETSEVKWQREVILMVVLVAGLFVYFLQL